MSPKLVQTYPHIVESWTFTMATFFFDIDIMKKSSLINLKFTFLPLSKPKWHFFSDALSNVAVYTKTKQPTKIFVKK